MEEERLKNIIFDIKEKKTETNNIEIKAAYKGCPEKLFDTLSSFSNQDEGGIIIFGIDENKNYNICGVYNASDLIKKVSEQCKQMEPNVRAFFTITIINDKKIVSAEIPSMNYNQRPCYYKGKGKYDGSYIRVGESDEKMSEYEIYSYESYKKRIRDDLRVIDDKEIKLFDNEKYNKYISCVKEERENLSKNVSNEEINELMGLTVNKIPTLASALIFSKYPQAYYPQLSIIATSIPGTKKGDLGDKKERFIESKRITGPIDEMLEHGMNFIRKNIKKNVVINNLGQRVDKYEYPLIALREGLLNALVHRDYSRYTESIPISIEIYTDRIEIINPGELYGGIKVSELGNIRPETRNIIIANILELLDISENRYSGIPTIKKELIQNKMPLPIFISRRGEFKLIIKKSFDEDSNLDEDKILNFCTSPRTRDEIASYLKLSKNHVMSKIIKPLVEKKKLYLTLPSKPNSSFQKYYSNDHTI